MGEPMDTILTNYADDEKASVMGAVIQVLEEIVAPHINVLGIEVLKKQLLLDVLKQMHANGHVFEAVPRSAAVANSAAVLAAHTDWFVALYKSADVAKAA